MSNIVNLDALIAGRSDTTFFQVKDPRGEPINMANARIYYMSKHDIQDDKADAIIDVYEEQPDTAESQDGWVFLTIPASSVPVTLVEDGNLEPVYGMGYQLSSSSDRVEISQGTQPIVRGVDEDPGWGS